MSSHPSATVIVSRRAREGQQRKARAWLTEITRLASQAEGYVRSEVQPPGHQHPQDWVVVYEFSNSVLLGRWLQSDARNEIMKGSPEIFDGAATEQVLATRNLEESVTAVASFRLRPEAQEPGVLDVQSVSEAFEEEYNHLVEVVGAFPGFLRCELFPPEPGVQDDTIIVFSFEDRGSLDGWLESGERQVVLARLRPLLVSERQLNIVGGFAGWFGVGGDRPVKTWKQAALVLLALYPTALVIGYIRDLIAPDLSGPVATFLGNAGGVLVLSWWLMPALTKKFAGWLRT